MDARSLAKELWKEMDSFFPRPYPNKVWAVPQPIPGTAFFPGGLGLWLENGHGPIPFPDIMVVGQDFNTITAYDRALQFGTEMHSSATWRAMRRVFPRLDVPFERCFFTNFYLGLRDSECGETGMFPGARDENFTRACARFFNLQMETFRPRFILALGIRPFRLLMQRVFEFDGVPGTLSACDRIYRLQADHGPVSLVALTHPSYYGVNVKHRTFETHAGMAAECEMIKAAFAL